MSLHHLQNFEKHLWVIFFQVLIQDRKLFLDSKSVPNSCFPLDEYIRILDRLVGRKNRWQRIHVVVRFLVNLCAFSLKSGRKCEYIRCLSCRITCFHNVSGLCCSGVHVEGERNRERAKENEIAIV